MILMGNIPMLILSCLIAYLLGSVSSGILVSKIAKGPDLRTVGSKNTGASNVQRTMGWKYGLITFFADAIKGVLSCLIAELLTGDHMAALPAGLCCVIGHNWPVFFGFKGGKGVATTGGVMLYCFPIPALFCIAGTIALIAAFRYISLGSLFMVVSFAIWSVFFSNGNIWIILWACVLMIMCIIRHHANIGRLLKGTENKLGNHSK
jgi:glycerol-3-phosphate acyltransferase PlsY